MELAQLAGVDLGHRTVSYEESDAILYALGVGAHATDLELVYERRLRVLPTFAITFGLWTIDAVAAFDAFDPLNVLHAGQAFELHRPLPRSATLEVHGRITGVWDKGAAAILDVAAECDFFEATYSMYLKGLGGWGGERGPSSRREEPTDEPIVVEEATSVDQAALYRLIGDDHPLHIDPEVAQQNGFDRPIMHGLCTLGFAARQLATALGQTPTDLRTFSARFAAPVFPGDRLTTRVWRDSESVAFETAVGTTTVLSSGTASFAR